MKSSPEAGEGGPRIGLALGSGSSRGWSHIGIIQALEEIGIRPQVIAGCSIGAIVGAAYSAGNLDSLRRWVTSLRKRDVAAFFQLDWRLNGLVDREKLRGFFSRHVAAPQARIEGLERTYASVATNLANGREIWFTEGDVLDSVMASISLPGLFGPFRHQGRWLVDGGLVNPVPVSLCHALGAEVVIAVNLNGDILGKHLGRSRKPEEAESGPFDNLLSTIKDYSSNLFPDNGRETVSPPNLFETIASSVNIIQDRITRSRMAGDPPDVLLTPRLAHIGLLEFHRAEEAIRLGRECVEIMRPAIEFAVNQR